MATLAEQLESALEGTGSAMSASDIGEMLSGTATSIQPGTITPITSQQSNQLSWNDVFKKISEGVQLQPGEGLPEVPKNIPASTFYRTATQAGSLPAGASQFFTKPLAPETPATFTQAQQTPATTTTTTTPTTSSQNVAQQLQESFDLQVDESDSFSGPLGDFDEFETYDTIDSIPAGIDVGLTHSDKDTGKYIGSDLYTKELEAAIGKVRANPGSMTVEEARPGSDLSLMEKAQIAALKGINQQIVNTIDKFQALTSTTLNIEHAKLGGTILGKVLGLPSIPVQIGMQLAQTIFSEGNGQIGRTGFDKDIYYDDNTFGTLSGASIAGFADKGGFLGVAVDEFGRELVDQNGIVMYGPPTDRGQKLWNERNKNPFVKPPAYPTIKSQGATLDDLIDADLDRDMPIGEDPTIDAPPDDYDPGGSGSESTDDAEGMDDAAPEE
tara:strand:+ start:1941 stop:3263 length:1323 start_codon:yes stop_codon:yes gene_type:complete